MDRPLAGLELLAVSKTYPGGIAGVREINLAVEPGEILALVGPSGSGKTTLLRSIAGLETIDSGEIAIGGRRVDDRSPGDRDIALVFQNQAPYPYLNVFENLAFGLRARRRSRPEIAERVAEVSSALGLDHLLGRRPSALSGGEKQRVALGRALARRPSLLLLDEPFSNLDTPLRVSARADLLRWQRRWKITTLIVTHDQAEALAIGDRVAVLDQGEIVQVGTPRDVYDRPATRFVGRFLGNPPMNVIPCETFVEGNLARLRVLGSATEAACLFAIAPGPPDLMPISDPKRIDLGFRPEDIALVEPSAPPRPDFFLFLTARIDRVEFRGDQAVATLQTGDLTITARVKPSQPVLAGGEVLVEIDLRHSTFFEPESGKRFDFSLLRSS